MTVAAIMGDLADLPAVHVDGEDVLVVPELRATRKLMVVRHITQAHPALVPAAGTPVSHVIAEHERVHGGKLACWLDHRHVPVDEWWALHDHTHA